MSEHRDFNTEQSALFSLAKEMASALLPAYYDGTQLSTADVDAVRAVVLRFVEEAFSDVLKNTKATHDCKQCETGFRVSTLYPAVEICMGEFKRIWAERMTLN